MQKSKKVTQRQKNSVHFCEGILHIRYTGDIENSKMVSSFLDTYLASAKKKAEVNRTNPSRVMTAKSLRNFWEAYGSVIEKGKNRRG